MKFDLLKCGMRFGRLLVIDKGPTPKPYTKRRILVKCECGVEKWVGWAEVARGGTKSCGCLFRELRDSQRVHNASESVLYSRWRSMIGRCCYPSSVGYKKYGARGITVCDQWRESYESFRLWATENGFSQELEIDRIDNNLGYSPDNCRFVTRAANMRNRRNTRYITAHGETKSLADWIDDPRCVVEKNTLRGRLDSGWKPEVALSTPSRYPGGSLKHKRERGWK